MTVQQNKKIETLHEVAIRLFILSFIGSLLLFLTPFLLWPGFGSDVFWSPLDIFILKNYPLWFIVLLPFTLGFLIEITPRYFLNYYFEKIELAWAKGEMRRSSYYLKSLIFICVVGFPFLVTLFLMESLDFNPLGSLLMYLARLKGYQGKYYDEVIALDMLAWFNSGIALCLATLSYLLGQKFKRQK